jgi:apolipoprotein N-acyltransferase
MAKSGFGIFIAALVFLSTYWNSYASETPPNNPSLNIAIIQKFTGKTGQFDQDKKIYKITIPRDAHDVRARACIVGRF